MRGVCEERFQSLCLHGELQPLLNPAGLQLCPPDETGQELLPRAAPSAASATHAGAQEGETPAPGPGAAGGCPQYPCRAGRKVLTQQLFKLKVAAARPPSSSEATVIRAEKWQFCFGNWHSLRYSSWK